MNLGVRPDEFVDLSEDLLEKNNLADERDKEEMDERREDLFAWRARVGAEYGDVLINVSLYSEPVSRKE